VPPDTWFTLEAEAVGGRIRIWVDRKLYVDWADPQETYSQGHIAIQAHHPGSHVQIRKLEVMELDQAGRAIVPGVGKDGGEPSRGSSAKAGSKASKRVARRVGLRSPADAKEFHGKFYKLFPKKLSWHEARLKCQALGGHLAVVKSEEENRFLMSLMKTHGVTVVWLGATDERVERTWVWVDGEPLRYSNWNPGQPNNKQGQEHFVVMIAGSSVAISRGVQDGKWHDQPNDSVQWAPGFICQWDKESE
jgi:Lectin C-type domain/Domain of Unknown Function (DUF1080)